MMLNLSPLQSKALFTFEFIGLNEYFQILRFLFKHCQENKQKVEIILATSVDLFTTCLFIWVSTAAKIQIQKCLNWEARVFHSKNFVLIKITYNSNHCNDATDHTEPVDDSDITNESLSYWCRKLKAILTIDCLLFYLCAFLRLFTYWFLVTCS